MVIYNFSGVFSFLAGNVTQLQKYRVEERAIVTSLNLDFSFFFYYCDFVVVKRKAKLINIDDDDFWGVEASL